MQTQLSYIATTIISCLNDYVYVVNCIYLWIHEHIILCVFVWGWGLGGLGPGLGVEGRDGGEMFVVHQLRRIKLFWMSTCLLT